MGALLINNLNSQLIVTLISGFYFSSFYGY